MPFESSIVLLSLYKRYLVYSSQEPSEIATNFISILQVRKLKHREIKTVPNLSHRTHERWCLYLNSAL